MKRLPTFKTNIFLFVLMIGLGNSSTVHAQLWGLKQKLGSSDQEPADNLGISVGISGSYMIAGAWWEEGDNGSNQPLTSAGAAYIYKMNPNGTWEEIQKLVSPNREVLGYYGFYVAIDGDYALVGAFNEDHSNAGNAGIVYAYHRSTNDHWDLDDSLKISNPGNNDYFGINLAISGEYALIGADGHDYDASNANFLDEAGAAYLYKRQSNNTWTQVRKLVAFDRTANDHFGKHVDIDEQGLVIGAFHKDGGIGEFEIGAAYGISCDAAICDFENITSSDLKKFVSPDKNSFEHFGWDVSISGQWAVAGKSGESDQPGGNTGSNTGAAYFFHWENGQWVGKQKVFAPDFTAGAKFGRSISMDGPVCVIGAGGEGRDGSGQNFVSGAGAAYIFELQSNNHWMPVQKLIGTRRGILDLFGEDAVDVNGIHVVVGAWLADTLGNGEIIDGGAAYIFERNSPLTAVQTFVKETEYLILNNPSMDGILLFQNTGEASGKTDVRIFTIDGIQLFQSESIQARNNQVDLSRLPSGMYFVQIQQSGYLPKTFKWIRL